MHVTFTKLCQCKVSPSHKSVLSPKAILSRYVRKLYHCNAYRKNSVNLYSKQFYQPAFYRHICSQIFVNVIVGPYYKCQFMLVNVTYARPIYTLMVLLSNLNICSCKETTQLIVI